MYHISKKAYKDIKKILSEYENIDFKIFGERTEEKCRDKAPINFAAFGNVSKENKITIEAEFNNISRRIKLPIKLEIVSEKTNTVLLQHILVTGKDF